MLKQKSLIAALVFFITCPAYGNELSVAEIVAKANHAALYQGQDMKGKVTMTIKDKQGFTRTRTFNMLRKDVDDKDQNQKYFVYFEEPADVRKMVFMVHKKTGNKESDDRWLYMPSLDLVKRIAASDKRTSFVGSDFLYEDISGRSPDEDFHELSQVTDRYYIIKNIPKRPEEVEFSYYLSSVDKETFLPVRIEFYKKDGRLFRTIEATQIEKISDYPTIVKSVARNLDTESESEMVSSKVQYNIGIEERVFSERYLRRPPREATR